MRELDADGARHHVASRARPAARTRWRVQDVQIRGRSREPHPSPFGVVRMVFFEMSSPTPSLLIDQREGVLTLTLNRPDYEAAPIPFVSSLPSFTGEEGRSPYPAASAEAVAPAGSAGAAGQ